MRSNGYGYIIIMMIINIWLSWAGPVPDLAPDPVLGNAEGNAGS